MEKLIKRQREKISKEEILVISAVFPPEPVTSAKMSYDIANALSETVDICVISPIPSRPLGFKFSDSSAKVDYKHILMNSFICPQSSIIGRLIESYSFGRHCYNYISKNKNKISLIYANTWPLVSQYFVVKAALKYKIPVVIHVQDIYPESFLTKLPFGKSILKPLLLPIDKLVLRNADKIIAVSDKMKIYLRNTRGVDSKKVHVVQNWQDEEKFIQYADNEEDKSSNGKLFTFMYLGNIGPVAGVDLLIDSFIKNQLTNCRLVIAGAGSQKKSLESYVKILNKSNIEFWSVPEGEVPKIQSYADVLLLPIKKSASLSSFPSKLPSYMFSSKPIIACVDEDSDIANVIKSMQCGWIVTPQNIDLLSNMMSYVISLPEEDLHFRGRNGYKYALANLSKKNNLKKVISIINEMISI